MGKINLHTHSKHSLDGTLDINEIINESFNNGISYLSITDHNTCKAYNDEFLKDNKIYTGKIVVGAELNATFNNRDIEILAYNIKDIEIIENWCQKYFSEEILRQKQENSRKILLDICDKKGLIYDVNAIRKDIPLTDFPSIYIYQELMRHKENYEILKGIVLEANVENADELVAFLDKQIVSLDNRAAKAKEKAAEKKAEGDELRAVVKAVLTDDFQTADDIAAQIEGDDVTKAKVVARLSQLVKNGEAEKEQIKNAEGKKVMTYKAIAE